MSTQRSSLPAQWWGYTLLLAVFIAGAPCMAQPQGPEPLPDQLQTMPDDMKRNHGQFDNGLTALYEQWLQGGLTRGTSPAESLEEVGSLGPIRALSCFGPDVRMSNPDFSGRQNEFQVAINPLDSRFAIGTSNDGRRAGVGIYRTADGGLTWTAQDAPTSTPACCDPAVVYGADGVAYVGVLRVNVPGFPDGQIMLRSEDNGATWQEVAFAALPDRNNLAVDPRDSNIVYITYSDLGFRGSGRIKGYRSTDGGQSWGSSFFVGGPAPARGYQQSSQPRVASDGTLYVGYQQYLDSSLGCNAGVQNVLARSTDGGGTFTHTVLDIVQGGACPTGQAGRGVFCIDRDRLLSFRSRSHPIIGVHPTNSQIVYMVYSGGDLEIPYTCDDASGFHSDTLFRKSTDGGQTFTNPININQDPVGADQYMPWMEVAPDGTIWVGWNDRRADPENIRSRWYQAFSINEGETWIEGPVSDDGVFTQPSTFIGDYHGLAAQNDRVLGMWYDSRDNPSGDPYTHSICP